ncbi:LOW QUALITY PROTEIN: serine/threonine-protein phosphatase 7 long form homolog [Brachypodium distachyon]|uniref:LOW QUALITY PROTEIN: serine/threonine-protein phosphatase 7 long form homolog n=1 Tax=Brachypodium distachyon TaxID=15368 RepID=UPI000D0CE716|nr:LOW QUALITY PROTEIN: serine/threonine-protein phosphatase 7 long form homolog [Brachypodium distachyon]|eukprot:XP_024312946.1 LOW QUALITY PROTEIN: serine/threonine-protein phosphatase 7 long form homolog [Brachypodium distachyon]
MALLSEHYDQHHRAHMMRDEMQELKPLKLRSHGASSNIMRYDERYTQYIETTELLPFIHLVTRSTPSLNAAAITALVDRWRPETHGFHLMTGEMKVTLQDVSMILALPIEGEPVCMDTNSSGWREQMRVLIKAPPPPPEAEDPIHDRVPAGATYTWITQNFAECPPDANEEAVQQYARVYVWYVITRTLFADGGGRTAQWMWLKALTVWDANWSWGTAALAYLYRQLDDACRRIGPESGIGGSLLLLSIWSWERLPVGRLKVLNFHPWDDHGNPLHRPTWAYKWDRVSESTSSTKILYKQYTNEFDGLTLEQVVWQPYGAGETFGETFEFELNPKCLEERHLWVMRCPMVCLWAVELHLPHHVMAQFGLFQINPPKRKDTGIGLHDLDRKKCKKLQNWPVVHGSHVDKFKRCIEKANEARGSQLREHCPLAFSNYVRWYLANTRATICPPAYDPEILEEPVLFNEVADLEYNRLVREGRQTDFAPILKFVREEIRKDADACESVLESTAKSQSGDGTLRDFVKRTGQRLRRLANIIGCRDTEIVSPSQSSSSSPSDDVEASTADDGSMQEGDDGDDDTTLSAWQRSVFVLKPRKPLKHYTPSDYEKRRKIVYDDEDAGEQEAEDEDGGEEEEKDVEPPRRRKTAVAKGKAIRRSTRMHTKK